LGLRVQIGKKSPSQQLRILNYLVLDIQESSCGQIDVDEYSYVMRYYAAKQSIAGKYLQ
jgi:hypothetical protein